MKLLGGIIRQSPGRGLGDLVLQKLTYCYYLLAYIFNLAHMKNKLDNRHELVTSLARLYQARIANYMRLIMAVINETALNLFY